MPDARYRMPDVRKSILPALMVLLMLGCSIGTPLQMQHIDDAAIAQLPAKGDVVVLNFWATWCEPCVQEIPIFVKIHERNRNVRVIGISMDDPDQELEVRKFVAKHHVKYEVVICNTQDFEAMVNSIDPNWIGGLPATFVYKNGKLVFSHMGLITEPELLRAINHGGTEAQRQH